LKGFDDMKTIAIIICAASIILVVIFGGLFFFLRESANAPNIPTYTTELPTYTVEPPFLEPSDADWEEFFEEIEEPLVPEVVLITYIVTPTSSNVWVDERNIHFNTYNIRGAIFFRLDDLAYALRGTEKAFSFSRDDTAIMLSNGQPTIGVVGLERHTESIEKIAIQEEMTLSYEGEEITLVSYQIEGYQYFSIREIADIIGFRVAWIGTRSTIIVDTTVDYRPNEPVFRREPLPEHIVELITGRTFRHDVPFGHYYLTYLTITHVDFHGVDRLGHLIVADAIGDEVLEIFREIYEARFPIYRMRLIDFYGADDYLSMAENNSHAFNFRYIAGTRTISRHGLGRAIDINPIQNPYIRGGTIWPYAGRAYLDRSYIRPGMVIRGDVVYRAFTSRGWIWGGNWTSPRDYHHFERRT